MQPVVQVSRNDITPQLRRYAAEMRRSWPAVVRQAGKGVVRYLFMITPPAHAGVTGAAARRAGTAKIARQMSAVLVPVTLKGRRRLTHVFGRPLARPIFVRTRERHPDVKAAYRERLVVKASGFGFTTGTKHVRLYVSRSKFSAELARRAGHVGRLASGWAAVAGAVDAPVQAWVARHGTQRGTARLDLAADRAQLVGRNLAPGVPAGVRERLIQQIPVALGYQVATMERAIIGYHQRVRASLGIAGRSRT